MTTSVCLLMAMLASVGAWFGPVSADPVSSAQSAWAPLPQNAVAPLRDARERRGQEVFAERCAACHAAVPKEPIGAPYIPPMPGTTARAARYRGAKPAELEQRTDLTAEFIAAIVRNGLSSMPFFRPTELGDDDVAALGAYLARRR